MTITNFGDNFEIEEDSNGDYVITYVPTDTVIERIDSGNEEKILEVGTRINDLTDATSGASVYDTATQTVGDGTTSANHDSIDADTSLKVPTYSDNTNAVQENESLWYNDGTGPDASGYYAYDGGLIGPFGEGGEWQEDGSGNIVPIDGETIGDGTTSANHGSVSTDSLNNGGPISDGDGTERQIWVIANGASDPSGADPEDIIFEEEA